MTTTTQPNSELENAFNQIKSKIKSVQSHFGLHVCPLKCFSEFEESAFNLIHSFTVHNKGRNRTLWLIEVATFEQFLQYLK